MFNSHLYVQQRRCCLVSSSPDQDLTHSIYNNHYMTIIEICFLHFMFYIPDLGIEQIKCEEIQNCVWMLAGKYVKE